MDSDYCYDDSCSSNSDDSEWDTKTETWSERVDGAIENIVKDFSKDRKRLNCVVCVRKNRRGACPDIKALVQHCGTVAEHKKKHRQFKEALEKAVQERGLSMRTLDVGNAATSETAFKRVEADDKGKIVQPYVLLVENVPLKSCDPVLCGMDEEWICCKLGDQGIRNFSYAGLLPESPDFLTTFGFKARAYAVFDQNDDLALAHEHLRQNGLGRGDWGAKEQRLRQIPTCEKLFGYRATVDDLKKLDPSRRVIKWHEVDFNETCFLPEVKRLEQTVALRKRGLEIETKKKKLAELRAKSEAGLEKQRLILERRQNELKSWKKRVEESELVLLKEREASSLRCEKEVEARSRDFETKMQELNNVDQEDSKAAQENFIAAFVAMKDAQEDLDEAQKLHDERVLEVINQKRAVDELRNSSLASSIETHKLVKETETIQKKLAAIEEQVELKRTRLAEASEPKEADDETMDEVYKQFEVLEQYGLSIDSLDHFDCAECYNSKCKQPLLKPPPISMKGTMPNYDAELRKSRSLLIPCCCAIYCMKCARFMVKKKMQCPKCNTGRPVEKAMEFTLFGYRD